MSSFFYIQTKIPSKVFPNFYLIGENEKGIRKALGKKGYKEEDIISITNRGSSWDHILLNQNKK